MARKIKLPKILKLWANEHARTLGTGGVQLFTGKRLEPYKNSELGKVGGAWDKFSNQGGQVAAAIAALYTGGMFLGGLGGAGATGAGATGAGATGAGATGAGATGAGATGAGATGAGATGAGAAGAGATGAGAAGGSQIPWAAILTNAARLGALAGSKKPKEVGIPSYYKEALTASRGLANVSEAPGAGEARESISQQQQNTIDSAKRAFTDPSQLASIISASDQAAKNANQDVSVRNMQFRNQAQLNLINQLGNLGRVQEGVRDVNYQRLADYRTAQSNLIGGIVQDANTVDNDYRTKKFLQDIGYIDYLNKYMKGDKVSQSSATVDDNWTVR